MKIENLIQAFELLLQHTAPEKGIFEDPAREELKDLIPEYLEEVFRIGRLGDLEQKVAQARKFNTEHLNRAIEIIESFRPEPYSMRYSDGQKTVQPNELLSELKTGTKLIEDHGEKWNPLEILLRIELSLDSKFEYLLMAFPENSAVFEKLSELAAQRLECLDNEEILFMWARLLNLFRESERSAYLRKYPGILADDFFENEDSHSVSGLRKKLALFITKLMPQTIKRMIEDGFSRFPAGFPGFAKIMTISQDRKLHTITNHDQLTIRLASQLVALSEALTFVEKGTFADAIGTKKDGLIFDGYFYADYKSKLESKKIRATTSDLLLMMKRLYRYATEYQTASSELSDTLWQYKLGEEIIAPASTQAILDGEINEIALQKSLSKYLIDRGILSFGRTFGRSQIDIYSKDFGEDFAIETKVYKSRPTEKMIRNHLVQLLSYLDQITQARGILAIYNCTDDIILSPRKWIGGRVWILVLNIGPSTASRRKRSLEVREVEDQSTLIACIDNDCVPDSKPQRSKSKTSKSSKKKA